MPASKQNGRVRIAGGSLRGRMLAVPDGVRPTPARARETLFNWLAPFVQQARCLDLFAGAGALGMEALSRGASECVFVESRREPVVMLRRALAEWDMSGAVERADALQWLGRAGREGLAPMDIVFLDPPFHSGLIARCCTLLADNGWLADNCRLYLESHKREPLPQLPEKLAVLRESVIGEVRIMLAGRSRTE